MKYRLSVGKEATSKIVFSANRLDFIPKD